MQRSILSSLDSYSGLIPLFVSAGILLAGNGLLGTLMAVRAEQEGFSTLSIGLLGTAHYIGFIAASWLTSPMIKEVGHIRVFSALAAISAAATLALVVFISPLFWLASRVAIGFCFAGLFTVMESWINDGVDNRNRAKALSIYVMVDLFAVTLSQFLLPIVGIGGFQIFSLTAIFFALSLVPVALSNHGAPRPPQGLTFDPGTLWRLSPTAVIGCFAVGLTSASFRLVGPVYASAMQLDVAGVAFFMSAGILGGALFQFPAGMVSDQVDRRYVLIACSILAALAGYTLALLEPGISPNVIYTAAFVFGAGAFPLYSLSVAHANDNLEQGQSVMAAAGLLFFFAIGAAIGPFAGAALMQNFDPASLFIFTSSVHLGLVVLTVLRLAQNPDMPEMRRRFTLLLRTSPTMFGLARRRGSRVFVDPPESQRQILDPEPSLTPDDKSHPDHR